MARSSPFGVPFPLEPDPPRQHPHPREHAIIRTLLGSAGPGVRSRAVADAATRALAGDAEGGPPALTVPAGDDAAVLPDGTALTVDALVEGIHWDGRLTPADVGFKAVAASVSDLGSMGARPRWMLLALSTRADDAWIEGFAAGLGEAARRWGVELVGGDTTGSPGPTVVSVTMGGACVAEPVTRAGARPGDEVWITGLPGLAGAGWMLDDPPAAALEALRRPAPPLEFALALAGQRLPTAMMDLSDGLASDLPRLCAASGVGAAIDPAALPLHPALAALPDPVAVQLGGGEDYQLLFTTAPGAPVEALARGLGVAVARVGRVTRGARVELLGRDWPAPAFDHFPAEAPR